MTESPDRSGSSLYPYVHGDPIPRGEAFEDNSAAAWDEWVEAGHRLEVALAKPPPPGPALGTERMAPAADDLVEVVSLACHAAILHPQSATLQHAHATRQNALPGAVQGRCRREQRGIGVLKFLQRLIGLGPDAGRRSGQGHSTPVVSGNPRSSQSDRNGW